MKFKRFLTAAVSGFMLLTSIPPIDTDAAFVPRDAVGSVTVNNETSYYYDKPSSGGAEAMWNTAMSGSSAMITLYADWTSSYGTRFGSGDGFIYDGTLNVPSGHEVTIDLNGFSINRNLEFSVEHGEVIHVSSGGVLNITDMSADTGISGSITGGYSSTGAGGIYIEAGGTVNLWGGNITGNQSDASGGGVLLAGESSEFSMSGGKIFGNSAQQCGGGVAVSDGTFKLASGEITDNTGQDGGGIYAQAGEVMISGGTIARNVAVHGGGILLNHTASMTLKGTTSVQSNIASGENRVGGGILAMSSVPIQLGGQPSVLNNSADGVQSNLVFWKDSEDKNQVLPCYVQNVGTQIEAKIGVSLSGGIRQAVFAPEWSGSDCFICDAMDYTLENKEGNLSLKRTLNYSALFSSKNMILLIITSVLIILAIIAILVLVFKKKSDKKKKKKSGKKKKKSGKKKVKVRKEKKAKSAVQPESDEAESNDSNNGDTAEDDNSEDIVIDEEKDNDDNTEDDDIIKEYDDDEEE